MKRKAIGAVDAEHTTKGVRQMTNRAIMALLAGTLALVLATGVAWAATVQCPALYEECLGTPDPDTLTGTSGQDAIRALAGSDLVRGMGEADVVIGGRGKDTVEGGAGPDTFLWGGESGPMSHGPFTDASDDHVYGGAGGDGLYGGYAQGGTDRLYGEEGNDSIETYQRGRVAQLGVKITKEIVNCGTGYDKVVFDKDIDEVAPNCEERYPVEPGAGPPPPIIERATTNAMTSVEGSLFE
jgi:RTX calcium-binding nonapeptide repeat (4 copies)